MSADDSLIDTHVHFWDHAVPGLRWPWLEPEFDDPHLNRPDRSGPRLVDLDSPRYAATEFRAESAGANVAGIVHADATVGSEDPVAETAWLQSMGEEDGLPDAIIGTCRLSDPGAASLMRRHAVHDRFRGVRDIRWDPDGDVDDVAAAMDAASEFGAVVELRAPHERFPVLAALARRWPDVMLALSHACLPRQRTPAELDVWRRGLRELSTHPNIVCKISAVAGASDPEWTVDSIRQWVLGPIEAFGADRCMLGTNWPVDRLFGSYDALVDAYREVIAPLDALSRAAVFHGTACRVYDLPTPATNG